MSIQSLKDFLEVVAWWQYSVDVALPTFLVQFQTQCFSKWLIFHIYVIFIDNCKLYAARRRM